MYQLVLLGTPYLVEQLNNNLSKKGIYFLRSLPEVQDNYPTLCLYFGQSQTDSNYTSSELDKYIDNFQVLPIVKDLERFNQYIPNQLSKINGLEVKNEGDLSKLANFVLSFFGLINVNRKIFISYKRSDTQTLAIQLFQALNFAGYQPFLDTSSIEEGKPFQQYLRHELSDSEMMLFLNSPNIKDSPYVLEELQVASELGVSIVNLKFDGYSIKQEAEISNVTTMGTCMGKDFQYPQEVISKIVKDVEKFRSQAFEQKRRFLLQEITERLSNPSIIWRQEYMLVNEDAIYPLVRIPVSQDLEFVEKKHVEVVRQKKIVYNGLYCRPDLREHLDWLNTKCKEVQSVDVKSL